MILDDKRIKPWESAITENNVCASGGFISPLSMLETDTRIIATRFPHRRESNRSGYIRPDMYALIPYSGRFGEGYIIATNRSKSSVHCEYYLDRKQRLLENG